MEVNEYAIRTWYEANAIRLNSLQRRIIALRYGLDGNRQSSLAEVSKELEISEERIRAEEADMMRVVRQSLRDSK